MNKFKMVALAAVAGLLGLAFIFSGSPALAQDLVWHTSVPAALAKAKTEKKLVLLDFTGSDWCSACLILDKQAFNQPEFAAYAATNLVLVQLDFPNHKTQSAELKAANDALQKQYSVEGFPTLIALQPDGTVAWRMDGFSGDIGPQTLITPLQAVKKL
jgi:thiol:disulfide interchange protein